MNKKLAIASVAGIVSAGGIYIATKDAPLYSEVQVVDERCVLINGINAGNPEDVKVNWPNHKDAIIQRMEEYKTEHERQN